MSDNHQLAEAIVERAGISPKLGRLIFSMLKLNSPSIAEMDMVLYAKAIAYARDNQHRLKRNFPDRPAERTNRPANGSFTFIRNSGEPHDTNY